MQLHLSNEEFNLLADILLNRGDPGNFLDHVLARKLDFGIDEFEKLRDTLIAYKAVLVGEAAHCDDVVRKRSIEISLSHLNSMIDKVSEACAML